MSSKPSKWLLSIKGGRHERKLGYFLSLGFFNNNNNNNNNNKQIGIAPQGRNFRGAEGTYVQKYFYGPLTGRRSPDSLLWHRH